MSANSSYERSAIEDMVVDGGKVHLRTPVGEPCECHDYKAANLDGVLRGVLSEKNQVLWN